MDGIAGGRAWRRVLAAVIGTLLLLTAWQAVEAWRAVQAHGDWRNSRACSAAAGPECRETVPARVAGREKDVRLRSVHYRLHLRVTSDAAAGDREGTGRVYRVRVLDDDAWERAAPGDRAELVRWRGEIRALRLDPGGPRQEIVQTPRHPSRLPAFPTGLAVLIGGFAATLAWLMVAYGRRTAGGVPRGITSRGDATWYPLVPAASLLVGTALAGTGGALAGRTNGWQAPDPPQILLYAAVAAAACVPMLTLVWLWQRRTFRKAYTSPRTPRTERTVRAVVWGDDDFHRPGYDGLLIGPDGVLASTPSPGVRVAPHPLPRDLALDRIRGPRPGDHVGIADSVQIVADCRTPDGRALHIGADHTDMRWIHGALRAGERHDL
ncbi:hypothetical protein [Actinomadura sediminis]|uniref:Uncharacterized protein n=1 Tax=Actinomadura sediminis TaxID=1038904 RepID=A0ABW3EPV4_9ACTN